MDKVIKLIPLFLLPIHIYTQNQDQFLVDYPEVPEKCEIRNVMDHQCCVFPPFFNRDAAKNCGGLFVVKFTNHANVSGFKRRSDEGCRYWRCLLKRYDLISLTDERKLDVVRYYNHLTAWVELNPEFNNVMVRAKMECTQNFKTSMPVRVCEFFRFNSCIRNYINVNCPIFIQTEECMAVKKFYEECREFFQ